MTADLNALVRLDLWPSGAGLLALGLISLAIGVVALTYALIKRGRTRAMTREEVTNQLMRRTADEQISYAVSTGTGVRREVSFGIDDLRVMAARGEWGLFWSMPICLFCFGFGIESIVMAASVWSQNAVFAVVGALGAAPFCIAGPFMVWAARYTNIDAGTADPVH